MTDAPAKKSDLGVRFVSAVVMIAVAGGALWAGGWIFTAFVGLIAIGLIWEWWGLVRKFANGPIKHVIWMICGLFYIGLACLYLPNYVNFYAHGSTVGFNFLETIAGLVISGVIATDVGAYFAGRTFGGPKIAPAISPSKTWSGLIGGMLTAGVVISILNYLHIGWQRERFGVELDVDWVGNFALGAIIATLAQSGDFLESWMKRRAGVKDSGNLIPGHGGLLDRADGMLAVFFTLSLAMLIEGWVGP